MIPPNCPDCGRDGQHIPARGGWYCAEDRPSECRRSGPIPVTELSPIVINIHGAKLLSSELSKNARIDGRKKARITSKHRTGTNGRVVCELVDHDPVVISRLRTRDDGQPCFTAYTLAGELYRVRRITLIRFAPARYSADGDNLSTLLSSVRDGVADALGVNDKVFVDNPTESDIQSGKIGITYKQIDGPWGLRIEIDPA